MNEKLEEFVAGLAAGEFTDEQLLGADPYSWAVGRIKFALDEALNRSGTMSEGEFGILKRLEGILAEEDPDLYG